VEAFVCTFGCVLGGSLQNIFLQNNMFIQRFGFRKDFETSASERIGRRSQVEFLNQMKNM
jgi:hypothetical protein